MAIIPPILSRKGNDPIEGFGVQRYIVSPSGAVGDSFPEDYSSYNIVGIANSIDGTIEFSSSLGKYNTIELDIINPVFSNVGMPHWVIEDTFEWINSGMPSHLSQVHHSNVIAGGISGERISPGNQEATAPAFQAKYIVPCNSEWYDKTNSTVDYELVTNNVPMEISLPYANIAIYIEEIGEVWVGGYGGLIRINKTTKNVTRFNIDSDRTLIIKDIKRYQDTLYILEETNLYIYDLSTESLTANAFVGLPKKLYSVASVFGSNIVIGAEDGIYAKKATATSWTKVVSTESAINIMYSPDAVLAITDLGEAYYSTDGFNWTRVGVLTDLVVNKIKKHRSQILFGTKNGLQQDGGSFYTSNLSLQLLDVLGNISESSEIVVNDIDSNFTSAVIGLSDGTWYIFSETFIEQEDSQLQTIHKVLLVENDVWLFGYDKFRVVSENFIRRLATGLLIR